jgi:Zinc finger, C3HC4 type (RING finger)
MRQLVQDRDQMTDFANELDGILRSERDKCAMQASHDQGRRVSSNASKDLADLRIKYNSTQERLKDLREKANKIEAGLEAVVERFQCGLCSERIVDRVSSCGHTLCEPCSTNWAETCKPHEFTCPMCRKPGDNITFTVIYYVG